mmetsp:Transcript_9199/g.13856  ORF Transcript_9199/g.13856 Transcript_9199/m.13856 type:complete len:302 (+) Transcript_9199:84-989(+)|eukprot:CAMPEP_0185027392 /NCGR_PEP_ID=MMETSP1103-20130426/12388_1 /TAXON_ID=36769 /ORGANISM="Paraphysomonas bandaiensis, Strain Caron Lab Isolate" /LENGTH=301 /DNA_ID=CAMNT_0027561371 /DNA_START=10 /DNA_END=915 /DNA_ORIENTATION=+
MTNKTKKCEFGDVGYTGSQLKETVKDIVASVFGSMACVGAGQPFDTVKVHLQVSPGKAKKAYAGLKETVTEEGILSLWKGSFPALVGMCMENATAFACNGFLSRMFASDNSPAYQPFLIGGAAGFCTAFVLCPPDNMKCRLQVLQLNGYEASMGSVISEMMSTQGIRGFYTGLGVQIMRDTPFFAVFFGSYSVVAGELKKRFNVNEHASAFVAGGLAGQISWTVCAPIDTVKSRMQTQGCRTGIEDCGVPVKSSIRIAKSIYQKQGIRGFYKGLEMFLLRAFPANGALFVTYQLSRNLMNW